MTSAKDKALPLLRDAVIWRSGEALPPRASSSGLPLTTLREPHPRGPKEPHSRAAAAERRLLAEETREQHADGNWPVTGEYVSGAQLQERTARSTYGSCTPSGRLCEIADWLGPDRAGQPVMYRGPLINRDMDKPLLGGDVVPGLGR